MPTLDVPKFRQDFPNLALKVYGRPLVYLDNAATSFKPQCVIDAVANHYAHGTSNVHRGVHYLSEQATKVFEDSRRSIQRFLNAKSAQEIIFTRGATEAINLVAQSFGRAFFREGDEILISAMEHHSNIVPWQMVCQQVGCTLKVAPINDKGELVFEEFLRLLTPQTRLVAMVYVSNSLGTINPIQEVIKQAHARNIPVLVDAAQAVTHLPVDVQALDCDFFAFSGHKIFGPTGIGVLYGKRALLESMPPYQGGGDMIASVTFAKTTYNSLPYKFEAGTPAIAQAIGLGTAINYVQSIGLENMAAHEQELLEYGTKVLSGIPGVRLIGTAARKASILSFVVEGIHPHDLGTIVNEDGVAIRTGHHCTQPVMEFFKVPATARASLAFYNTKEELDCLAEAIYRAKEIFKVTAMRDELYQQTILEHNRNPRNYKKLEGATHVAEGYNPLCGDHLWVYMKVNTAGIIEEAAFEGSGCAISKASASMMTADLKGKSMAEAKVLFEEFHQLVTGGLKPDQKPNHLGKLAVFSGIWQYPARVKCAILSWHTMNGALDKAKTVSTE